MESSFTPQIHNISNANEEDNIEGEMDSQNSQKPIPALPLPWQDALGGMSQYQGFWFTNKFLEGIMSAQEHFKAQPWNIFLCSAPKTGTTWLKALAFSIITKNSFSDSTNPLLDNNPHDCIPFLEVDLVQDVPHRFSNLPLLATHAPYNSLPKSAISSGCKIIYICRDPKDAFVSLWHFAKKLTFMEEYSITMEKAIEVFCEGTYPYGPYWDHMLGYWKASLERPDKILFLKYEDIKKDPLSNVKTMATFMGQPFSAEEEKQGLVEKIVQLCSFEHLSNLEVNKTGKHRPETHIAADNSSFFRKGEVGDSEYYLTAEMREKLDRIMDEKLGGSGLTFKSQK